MYVLGKRQHALVCNGELAWSLFNFLCMYVYGAKAILSGLPKSLWPGLFTVPWHILPLLHANCIFSQLWLQLIWFWTWLVGNLPLCSFCTEAFFVYTMYVQDLAQCFHSLSQSNSKTGPCHRKYASIQFPDGFEWLNSDLKVMKYAQTITLK